MSNQLSDIEKRIQNLIEVHLVKYLPVSSNQDRIAQQLADVLRANFTTQNPEETPRIIPDHYLLVVHPAKMAQWQSDSRLMDELTAVFKLAADESGIKFTSSPSIELTADPSMPFDKIDIRPSSEENIAETQNLTQSSSDEMPKRAAFLIVGGTKVFPLDQAVTNIGRRLDNHLVVDDPRVSRYHSQIRYVRGRFIIFDLNSTGGTFINGQRTAQSVLYPGDVVSLAGLPIVFGQDNPPPAIQTGDTAPLSPVSSERKTVNLANESDDDLT